MNIKTKLGRSLLAITMIAPLVLTGCGKSDPALDAISVKEQNWEKKAKGLDGDEKEIQSLVYKLWDLKDREEVMKYQIENSCASLADRVREYYAPDGVTQNLPLNAYPNWRALSQSEVFIDAEPLLDEYELGQYSPSERKEVEEKVSQELSGMYQKRVVRVVKDDDSRADRSYIFKKEDGQWKFCSQNDWNLAVEPIRNAVYLRR